jgi:hypothetical protein
MLRPTTLLLIVLVLLAGGALWSSHERLAEAGKPRESCTDELTRTKRELAKALEAAERAKQQAAEAGRKLEAALKKEQARVERLHQQLGAVPVQELK